jgi:hypothetical protein
MLLKRRLVTVVAGLMLVLSMAVTPVSATTLPAPREFSVCGVIRSLGSTLPDTRLAQAAYAFVLRSFSCET